MALPFEGVTWEFIGQRHHIKPEELWAHRCCSFLSGGQRMRLQAFLPWCRKACVWPFSVALSAWCMPHMSRTEIIPMMMRAAELVRF